MIDIKLDIDTNRAIAIDNNIVIGECNYTVDSNTWNITHTIVSNEYQGQGIARRLVECIIEYTTNNKIHLVSSCSYAEKILHSR